jgi:hypothetical protein
MAPVGLLQFNDPELPPLPHVSPDRPDLIDDELLAAGPAARLQPEFLHLQEQRPIREFPPHLAHGSLRARSSSMEIPSPLLPVLRRK